MLLCSSMGRRRIACFLQLRSDFILTVECGRAWLLLRDVACASPVSALLLQ